MNSAADSESSSQPAMGGSKEPERDPRKPIARSVFELTPRESLTVFMDVATGESLTDCLMVEYHLQDVL